MNNVFTTILMMVTLPMMGQGCIDENAINYGSDTTCVYSQEYVQFLLDEIEWLEFPSHDP